MLRNVYIFLIAILALGTTQAQVPADSLVGIYAGQCYYANPSTEQWAITQDTVYVASVDTLTCLDIIYGGCGSGTFTLYTTYTYCNSFPPTNHFSLFHNNDSLTYIADNNPNPPPSTTTWSIRFYGKRIGHFINGIENLQANKEQIKISPNPANYNITIEIPQQSTIEILNIQGQIIKEEKTKDNKTTLDHVGCASYVVDISGFESGVYIIRATTEGGEITKKFIKE
jgi:hypothetical protein